MLLRPMRDVFASASSEELRSRTDMKRLSSSQHFYLQAENTYADALNHVHNTRIDMHNTFAFKR